MRIFKKIADNSSNDSLATMLRQKRFESFFELVDSIDKKNLTILDIGGTMNYWNKIDLKRLKRKVSKIILLNVFKQEVQGIFESIAGDARNLSQFTDDQVDIIFSNSVIEHFSSYDDQKNMANEILRVGKYHYVQTPNKYFPIEPHFLFPFFQFLPLRFRAILLNNFNLGWMRKRNSYSEALHECAMVRLLTKKEFQSLFPDSIILDEKFLNFTKSFMAISSQ